MIHGMVDRPLMFTMDELKRRRLSRGCISSNAPEPRTAAAHNRPGHTRVDQLCRMDRRSASLQLREAGVQSGAS
jgi:hypothetical protein